MELCLITSENIWYIFVSLETKYPALYYASLLSYRPRSSFRFLKKISQLIYYLQLCLAISHSSLADCNSGTIQILPFVGNTTIEPKNITTTSGYTGKFFD